MLVGMRSLLDRLFKYQPTEGRSPKEDFFTEAFGGVLEACPEVACALMQWVTDREVRGPRVVTQRVVDVDGDRLRLDMWIEARDHSDGRHLVVFENKLHAKEGDGQLARYEGYLARQDALETRTLVYMTMHERSEFRSSCSAVYFRNAHWLELYDWLKKWVGDRSDRTGVLVRELLDLMEAWGMEMGLGAHDLAMAVAYKGRIQSQLLKILDEVWDACRNDGRSGSKWSYDRNDLSYQSAFIGDNDIYYYFGFDFGRSDAEWDASRLQLPSAYFALCGADAAVHDWSGLSAEWVRPPDSWGWDASARVRRLNVLEAAGVGLHECYRRFFLSSLDQARDALVSAGSYSA